MVLKDILTPKEINRLAAFRYEGEHREIQRAFIFCCYTGLRFCDVSNLTYGNIDSESMVMRFNQKKAVGRSAHASVVTPLNEELLKLIGNPREEDNLREKIFHLPHTTTAQKHLSRWISLAGIKKKITWHLLTPQFCRQPSQCRNGHKDRIIIAGTCEHKDDGEISPRHRFKEAEGDKQTWQDYV